MKTQVIERYYNNGQLDYRYHVTTDGKYHGFYELYYSDGTIYYLGYYSMHKEVKLENNYYSYIDIVIRYHI